VVNAYHPSTTAPTTTAFLRHFSPARCVTTTKQQPTSLCLQKRSPQVVVSWKPRQTNDSTRLFVSGDSTPPEQALEDANVIPNTPFVQTDPLLKETARILRRTSWFSWWSQVILTVVSSVILVFAKSVLAGRSDNGPSFFLSGSGVLLSAVSIVWTWGNGARLSRRLTVKPVSRFTAAHMLRRAVRVGVTVNLLGLLCNLLAAEQIIGSLAIKVLTTTTTNRATMFAAGMEGALQPLDVLVVQANTNSLLSQFCSLVSLLYVTTATVHKLDPPSTDEAPRGK
jgi:Protein of unknown function (DUF3611)